MKEMNENLEGQDLENLDPEVKKDAGMDYEQAVALLAQYKQMKQEIRTAKKTVFTHAVKAGKEAVVSKLKLIEEKYMEAKKAIQARVDSVKSVGTAAKGIAKDVKDEAEDQRDANEDFEQEQTDRNEYESKHLDGKIGRTKTASDIRTFLGSIQARMAKMPKTFAARYAAVKGDDKKKEEFLREAEATSKRIMKGVKGKNRAKQLKTQKSVTARNNIEKRAEQQGKTIDNKAKRAEDRADAWQEGYSDGGKRGKVAAGIRRIDTFSGKAAKFVAKAGQMPLTTLSRLLTTLGARESAETVSKAAGKFSRTVMDSASKMATKRHKSFDSKVSSFDRAAKTADSLEGRVDNTGKKQVSKNEAYRSEHEGEKSGKHITKATRGITGFITKAGQFLAKGKVSRYEFAAKAAALLGDKEGARNLMARAKVKSDRTMERTGKVNDAVRGAADWTIDAKDTVVNGTKTAVEATGRAIGNATRATGRAAATVAGVAAYGAVEGVRAVGKGARAVGRGFKKAFTSTIKFGSDLVEKGSETVEQLREEAQAKAEQRSISRLRGQIEKRKGKIIELESALFEKEAMAAARAEKAPTKPEETRTEETQLDQR